MLLPSNDAFIANADETGFQIFDAMGNFVGADFFVSTAEGIALHAGFLAAGNGGILDAAQFANADFLRAGYPIAQIRITQVPVPGAALFMLSGLGGLLGFMRTR